ncbi:phage head-tail connector protein [Peribacillus butanolivorans]|uniref:phage head-tail connector protein n=1 Tax=Peribacillus butanolivorans TaxID=421767 RepID=UPI002E214D9F|nr:phage head-tail connector protein [Peribacillus butanolivorans]
MDKEEVKNILGITTNKHDVYITTCIPLFVDFIKEHCNNSFPDDISGGVKIAVAKMIEWNMNKSGQKTRSIGEVAYSFDTDFPPSILRLLQPYNRIRV